MRENKFEELKKEEPEEDEEVFVQIRSDAREVSSDLGRFGLISPNEKKIYPQLFPHRLLPLLLFLSSCTQQIVLVVVVTYFTSSSSSPTDKSSSDI